MSEPSNKLPKPKTLAAPVTTGKPTPRTLMGAGSLGNLKLSITPEQAAAQERAREAARTAEEARLAEEARYAEELRQYEEQVRAAEEARLAEEARYAEELRQYEEQLKIAQEAESTQTVEAQMAQEAALKAAAEAQAIADQAVATALAAAAKAQAALAAAGLAPTSPSTTPEINTQVAAAEALAAKAAAMRTSSQATPQTATPIPTPLLKNTTPPTPAPATSIPMPDAGLQPAPAPSLTPTQPFGGVVRPSSTKASSFTPTEAAPTVPLYKKKPVIIGFIVIMLALGGIAYSSLAKRAEEQRINDRYVEFVKKGANDDIERIDALKEDFFFVLEKIKTDDKNWQAAARTLQKMTKGNPDFASLLLDEITKSPKAFNKEKTLRLLYFVATLKPAPEDHRQNMLVFLKQAPLDVRTELIWYIHPLLTEDDIPFLIDIITSPEGEANAKLANNAEKAAGKVMNRATNKSELVRRIKEEYDKVDEKKKNTFIRLMGKTGDATGLAFLKNLLEKGDNIVVKRNALKGLGSWTNDDAIAILLEAQKSPFGQAPDTGKFVEEELFRSLSAPGRERDMSKLKPLLDQIKSTSERQSEKLRFIGMLATNAHTDKWAIELIKSYENDADEKVSYEAEKALERINSRKPTGPKSEAKEADPATPSLD